jgi:hypothetical protein
MVRGSCELGHKQSNACPLSPCLSPVAFIFGLGANEFVCVDDDLVEFLGDGGETITNAYDDTVATITLRPISSCALVCDEGDCGELATGETCALPSLNFEPCQLE